MRHSREFEIYARVEAGPLQRLGIFLLRYTQHVSNVCTEQSELYPFSLDIV